MNKNALEAFLGDKPLRIVIKLVILAFIAGAVMSFFGFGAVDLWHMTFHFFHRVFSVTFNSFSSVMMLVVNGLLLVVPIFLLIRFLKHKDPK